MSKTKTKPEPPRVQDLTRAEKREILRSVPCDCGAKAGQRCRSGNGSFNSHTHAARYAAVGKFGKDLIRW